MWNTRVSKWAVSAVIIVILGTEVTAIILGTGRSWPFVDYPMFSTHVSAGRTLYRPSIYGRLADSRALRLYPERLSAGLGGAFRQRFLTAAFCLVNVSSVGRYTEYVDRRRQGCPETNENMEIMQTFVGIYRRRTGQDIMHLWLELAPVKLSETGLKQLPAEIVGQLSLGPQ